MNNYFASNLLSACEFIFKNKQRFHKDIINNLTANACDCYQRNYRFYMDEYPNVEEWDYLPLFDNTIIMKRFLRRD